MTNEKIYQLWSSPTKKIRGTNSFMTRYYKTWTFNNLFCFFTVCFYLATDITKKIKNLKIIFQKMFFAKYFLITNIHMKCYSVIMSHKEKWDSGWFDVVSVSLPICQPTIEYIGYSEKCIEFSPWSVPQVIWHTHSPGIHIHPDLEIYTLNQFNHN